MEKPYYLDRYISCKMFSIILCTSVGACSDVCDVTLYIKGVFLKGSLRIFGGRAMLSLWNLEG